MLDPAMQADVLSRIKDIQEELEHHRMMANTAASKIALLTRTWELCPHPRPATGFCCNDPVDCQGRQP